MKLAGKIILTILSVLSFLIFAFFVFSYFFSGLGYLYYSQNVVNRVYIFLAIALLALIVLIAMIVMMFKGKKWIRIICTILLVLFIPAALFGSWKAFCYSISLGPNGCSYTEDPANYGKYDEDVYAPSYFPDTVTEDMTVVKFAYFYKITDLALLNDLDDLGQTDIYLEVRFENAEILDQYLAKAKDALCADGTVAYENPYDPQYTNVIGKTETNYISYGKDDDYKYVKMEFRSVTYSYEDLTIIYNFTSLDNDIMVGHDPDDAEYYPQFLQRFGVEWDEIIAFYKYAEK